MLWLRKNIVYLALIQAIAATIGSLYFSEAKNFVPCLLCWYQRILMYPLVLLIAVGILKKDKGLPSYILPLSILGMAVAFYQYLLQMGWLPESSLPCTLGVSCATRYVAWFGFVTIPFLSFTAFTIITISMIIMRKVNKK